MKTIYANDFYSISSTEETSKFFIKEKIDSYDKRDIEVTFIIPGLSTLQSIVTTEDNKLVRLGISPYPERYVFSSYDRNEQYEIRTPHEYKTPSPYTRSSILDVYVSSVTDHTITICFSIYLFERMSATVYSK